jgi:hypothetical protein
VASGRRIQMLIAKDQDGMLGECALNPQKSRVVDMRGQVDTENLCAKQRTQGPERQRIHRGHISESGMRSVSVKPSFRERCKRRPEQSSKILPSEQSSCSYRGARRFQVAPPWCGARTTLSSLRNSIGTGGNSYRRFVPINVESGAAIVSVCNTRISSGSSTMRPRAVLIK